MSVTEMLQESMAAHRQALKARRRHEYTEARELLVKARDLRRDAHDADPEHESPAWRQEQQHTPVGRNTHEEMMTFYREQLGRG